MTPYRTAVQSCYHNTSWVIRSQVDGRGSFFLHHVDVSRTQKRTTRQGVEVKGIYWNFTGAMQVSVRVCVCVSSSGEGKPLPASQVTSASTTSTGSKTPQNTNPRHRISDCDIVPPNSSFNTRDNWFHHLRPIIEWRQHFIYGKQKVQLFYKYRKHWPIYSVVRRNFRNFVKHCLQHTF